MGKLIVVAGAQFGSEGKGAVSDHLTRDENNPGTDVVGVRVAGPNAGHTVVGHACPPECTENHDPGRHPWRLRAVPVAAVSNPYAKLVIAAGSEIDLGVLEQELADLDAAGYQASDRMYIDAQATLLEPRHIEQEKAAEISKRLGSTAKGIGASRADRIWRSARLACAELDTCDTAELMRDWLGRGETVLIEGTQGYGLGLHAGNYPYCTSSNCRAVDFLAMAGLNPWAPHVTSFEVWLAARVRPIRVAGNSGPLKGETTWDELGLPKEYTTVTKKERRVGEWDGEMTRAAVKANGGDPTVRLAVTMADTMFPKLAGLQGQWRDQDPEVIRGAADWLFDVADEAGAEVGFVGTGPDTGLWLPVGFDRP